MGRRMRQRLLRSAFCCGVGRHEAEATASVGRTQGASDDAVGTSTRGVVEMPAVASSDDKRAMLSEQDPSQWQT
eukprot:5931130-Prymnesium_polylepis.1